jgi:prepilin-type N-terminal cleavage/methylation domain-containing protein
VKRIKSRGFTLIEVITVVAILGVISGIAVLSVMGIIEKSRRDVCNVNVIQFERMYESFLDLEGIEHSNIIFAQYQQDYGEDIYPENGDISYVDGEVRCSLHQKDSDGGDDDSGEEEDDVPYL